MLGFSLQVLGLRQTHSLSHIRGQLNRGISRRGPSLFRKPSRAMLPAKTPISDLEMSPRTLRNRLIDRQLRGERAVEIANALWKALDTMKDYDIMLSPPQTSPHNGSMYQSLTSPVAMAENRSPTSPPKGQDTQTPEEKKLSPGLGRRSRALRMGNSRTFRNPKKPLFSQQPRWSLENAMKEQPLTPTEQSQGVMTDGSQNQRPEFQTSTASSPEERPSVPPHFKRRPPSPSAGIMSPPRASLSSTPKPQDPHQHQHQSPSQSPSQSSSQSPSKSPSSSSISSLDTLSSNDLDQLFDSPKRNPKAWILSSKSNKRRSKRAVTAPPQERRRRPNTSPPEKPTSLTPQRVPRSPIPAKSTPSEVPHNQVNQPQVQGGEADPADKAGSGRVAAVSGKSTTPIITYSSAASILRNRGVSRLPQEVDGPIDRPPPSAEAVAAPTEVPAIAESTDSSAVNASFGREGAVPSRDPTPHDTEQRPDLLKSGPTAPSTTSQARGEDYGGASISSFASLDAQSPLSTPKQSTHLTVNTSPLHASGNASYQSPKPQADEFNVLEEVKGSDTRSMADSVREALASSIRDGFATWMRSCSNTSASLTNSFLDNLSQQSHPPKRQRVASPPSLSQEQQQKSVSQSSPPNVATTPPTQSSSSHVALPSFAVSPASPESEGKSPCFDVSHAQSPRDEAVDAGRDVAEQQGPPAIETSGAHPGANEPMTPEKHSGVTEEEEGDVDMEAAAALEIAEAFVPLAQRRPKRRNAKPRRPRDYFLGTKPEKGYICPWSNDGGYIDEQLKSDSEDSEPEYDTLSQLLTPKGGRKWKQSNARSSPQDRRKGEQGSPTTGGTLGSLSTKGYVGNVSPSSSGKYKTRSKTKSRSVPKSKPKRRR